MMGKRGLTLTVVLLETPTKFQLFRFSSRVSFPVSFSMLSNLFLFDCIQIDKVPYEHLAIDQLNEHFKKFGLIVNIQLFPHEKRALIEFSSNAEAQAAVKSPDPIFGNRYGFLPSFPHIVFKS